MPPRSLTNPPPKTESAREARKSFFCELCNKGYSRQNEFQAHESSYDHQHKKRLKDLKAMNRTMMDAGSKARQKDEKGSGLIKIAAFGKGTGSNSTTGGGGFKKGGFKNAFASVEPESKEQGKESVVSELGGETSATGEGQKVDEGKVDNLVNLESDTDEDEAEEIYNPRRPTGCPEHCKGRSIIQVS